jgi:hypothetical protein
MKQVNFILLTVVVVICAAAALTQAGPHERRMRTHDGSSAGRSQGVSTSDNSLASAAMQRWRLGGSTHWRSLLLHR